jgi:hypothetical protein
VLQRTGVRDFERQLHTGEEKGYKIQQKDRDTNRIKRIKT